MITGTMLRVADLRQQVDAVDLWHHDVEQHEIGLSLVDLAQRLAGIRRPR